MYDFVVGIDRRINRLGIDLEWYLCTACNHINFIVEDVHSDLELRSIQALTEQTDSLLEAIVMYESWYYVALSTASVTLPSQVGPIPTLTTVLTAVDVNGRVLCDCIKPLGHWVPPSQRNYSKYCTPDLLDLVGAVVNGLSNPELMPG